MQIDIEFVKLHYQPTLKLNKINDRDNRTIRTYVNNNLDKFRWTNYNDFIADTKFDYKFYSVYNNVQFIESHCIYHYINHGVFSNFATNLDDYISKNPQPYISNVNTLLNGRILIVTHELSLTGGGLVAIDLYKYYISHGCDAEIMNLSNISTFVDPLIKVINKTNLSNIIEQYDYIVVNTIAHNVQEWCIENKEYMNRFVLWLHEVDDVYYNFKMKELKFKYVIMDSYHAYDVFVNKSDKSNQLLKVLYLPNPLYISTFENREQSRADLRAQHGISNDATVFLNLGVIAPYKNQIEIVKAIEKYMLNDNIDSLNFVVVLVGNRRKNLIFDYINTSSKKKQLSKYIKILPPLPHDKTNVYYAMSDVYLSSAHTEVYGKVIVEAMELSLPVLGYIGGSHLELIKHDYNGLHYNSEQELAKYIKLLSQNRNLIELYGKQAHWYYKLKVPTIESFYNQFNGIMEICKKNLSFNIKLNKQEQNDKLKLLESNVWTYNDIIHVFGGYKEDTSLNTMLYKVDTNTLNIVDTIPIPKNCSKTHVGRIIHKQNVLFMSGQLDGGYGKATDACYTYSNDAGTFTELNKINSCYYDLKGFIRERDLIMFSGGLEDRSTPHFNVLKCQILDENDNLIFNNCNKWELEETKFAGTIHSSLTHYKDDKHIYIGGCQCHACNADPKPEWHLYIHNQANYIIDTSFNMVNISSQQFQVSHVHSSCIYNPILNALIVIGGQINYDIIYYGLQIYYFDYDVWANITIDKSIECAFNKGCCATILNNKLYLLGGQIKSYKFTNMISIFDIE